MIKPAQPSPEPWPPDWPGLAVSINTNIRKGPFIVLEEGLDGGAGQNNQRINLGEALVRLRSLIMGSRARRRAAAIETVGCGLLPRFRQPSVFSSLLPVLRPRTASVAVVAHTDLSCASPSCTTLPRFG